MNLLGQGFYTEINGALFIYNVFGQFDCGSDGKRYTDYCALNEAFKSFQYLVDTFKLPVYFPYYMGAGLGGGDWNVISKMIEHYFPDAIICKLPA